MNKTKQKMHVKQILHAIYIEGKQVCNEEIVLVRFDV